MSDPITILITVDGTTYRFRPTEVSANLARECRREAGWSVRALIEAAQNDPDIDVIATLVWLARRQASEQVGFDEVADAITYGSDFDLGEAGEDDDPGEAHAAV